MTIKEIKACLESTLKSIHKGYAWGPFDIEEDLPELLKDGHISPIFTKDESTETIQKIRMLINLSFKNSERGYSFNDNIYDKEKEVTYIKFKEIVQFIVENDIIYLWAMDALDAYYRVPIEKQQIKYMGIRLCKMVFYFSCLVFGLSSACRLYTKFADAVQTIIVENNPKIFKNKIKQTLLKHYLDDFIGGHNNKNIAQQQFEEAQRMWEELGIPTQPRKCTPPTTAIEWLGYIFDTVNREVRIAPERIKRYTKTCSKFIQKYKDKKSVTKVELQSMVGKMRSMSQVFCYIAPYLRRAEEKANQLREAHHRTSLTRDIFLDIKSLKNILLHYKHNTIPFDFIVRPRNKADYTIYTDASTKRGVGGFIARNTNSPHFKIMWNELENYSYLNEPDIAWKELCGVVLATLLYAKIFANKVIYFRCDNWAVCKIVAKKCACFKRRDLNALIRILCETAIKYKFYIWINHIKGIKNDLADALSRGYDTKQYEYEYKLSSNKTDCYKQTETLYKSYISSKIAMRHNDFCDCKAHLEGECCDYLSEIFVKNKF